MVIDKDAVKRAAENKGFSRYDLFKETGLAWNTILSAYAGTDIHIESIVRLSEALGVSVEELTGGPRTVGVSLAISRTMRGITRRELAERSGVHIKAIGRYEIGVNEPSLWTAYCLACSLGMTINECFGLDVGFAEEKELAYNVPN
jgi:transcriptional regulator with XRE-family HTH domain